jgi:hypothetical protein
VRRAKLYYLRDKVGRHARIRERRQPIGGGATVVRRHDAEIPGEVEPEDVDFVPELDPEAEAESAAAVAKAAGETPEATTDTAEPAAVGAGEGSTE